MKPLPFASIQLLHQPCITNGVMRETKTVLDFCSRHWNLKLSYSPRVSVFSIGVLFLSQRRNAVSKRDSQTECTYF